MNTPRSFRIILSGREAEATSVLPVRDETGAVVSVLATFPSSLYPLPSQTMASIEGMQQAPLLLGAIQKNKSLFNIDAPMGVSFSEGEATFRVFAPNADRLDIELFGSLSDSTPSRTVEMRRGDNGVWEATAARAEAVGMYYSYAFLLAGERQPASVSDPAAINHVGRPR